MKPGAFNYLRARDATEAIALMQAAGEDARFLAGGQSLVPLMNFRLARPTALVDLNGCGDLAYVRRDDAWLRVGAMTRQRTAGDDPLVARHCPLLAKALAHAGPATIRNRATIGGSMANGYPLAQLPCVALCLGAEMTVEGPGGRRTVPADQFFISAMVTDLRPGELLREIAFPVSPAPRHAFREAGNHAGGAAQAVVCVAAEHELRIAASGLEPVPLRLTRDFRAAAESYSQAVVRALLDEALAEVGA